MNLLNTLWDGESKERTETKKNHFENQNHWESILDLRERERERERGERERERERERLYFQVKIPIHFQIQNKDNQKTNSWQNPTPK